MHPSELMIIRSGDVARLLAGRELELVEIVRDAYLCHAWGWSALPQSTFLRFPADPVNRIIALPAWLGGGFDAAGIKWISSFPANVERGMDRASAVIVLNSMDTGRPTAILEGSLISARRTAASAALAAMRLRTSREPCRVGLVGGGVIGFETLRFLTATCPEIDSVAVFDLNPERAAAFASRCSDTFPGIEACVEMNLDGVLRGSGLVVFTTTAGTPHADDLSACPPGAVVLHISLRDLDPRVILESDNFVDDVEHVCRAQTSIHLAEQMVGHRRFINGTLADILPGVPPERRSPARPVIFSPFGLGILDLAVAKFVHRLALDSGAGLIVHDFLPAPGAREPAAAHPVRR